MNALLRAETTNEMLLFDDKEKPKDLGEKFLEKRSNSSHLCRVRVNQTQAKLVKGECFDHYENLYPGIPCKRKLHSHSHWVVQVYPLQRKQNQHETNQW